MAGTNVGGSISFYGLVAGENWIYYDELPDGFIYRDDYIDENKKWHIEAE